MARLPQPGGDSGNWGNILNEYLSQTLDTDGTIKDNVVTNSTIAPGAVTATEIASDAVGSSQIADGSITEVLLASTVQTKLNQGGAIADGSITKAKLATGVQTTLDKADSALQTAPVTSVNTRTGAITLTSTDVGLGSVNNTSDNAKPVSSAQQSALDLKAPLASPTFTGTVSGVTKSMVGLGNVDNTADTAKPISTAQQSALDLKAPLASPTFTGTVSGITKSAVGLGNVDNTADTAKPVSSAQQTALDGKQPLDSDLTSIAALSTTSFGRSLLTQADAPSTVATLGLANPIVLTPTGVAATDGPAMDAAVVTAQTTGRPIYLQAGTFRRTTEWNLRAGSGLRIMGAGRDVGSLGKGTLIECTVDTVDLIGIGGFANYLSDFTVRHSNFTPTGTTGSGLSFYKNAYTSIKRVDVYNAYNLIHIPQVDVQDLGTGTGTGNYGFFSNTFEDLGLHNYSNSGIWAHAYNGALTGSVFSNIYVQNGSPGSARSSTGNPVDLFVVDEMVFNQLNIEDHAGTGIGILLNAGQAMFNSVHFERVNLNNWESSYIVSYGDSQMIVNELTIAYGDFAATGAGDYSSVFRVAAGGRLMASGVWIHESTKTGAIPWYLGIGGDTDSRNSLTVDTIPLVKTGSPAFTALTNSTGPVNGIKRLGDVIYSARINPRVGTTTSTATPAINSDNYDVYTITALAVNITGFTMSGTPTDGQKLHIAITGTATRTIAWGTSFEASTVALPTTTSGTSRLDTDFIWNAITSKWRVAVESTGSGAGTTTATASTLALRDSNANVLADAFIPSLSSTPTAAGTTTLTADSNEVQIFTGTAVQTVLLPSTAVAAGQRYAITNNSTAALTINASGGTTVALLPGGGQSLVVTANVAAPTTNTQWSITSTTASIGFDYLPAAFATLPRTNGQDIGTTNQELVLNYFTADKTATISNIRAQGGSVAAGATPTLIRFGIYSVAANGDLTLIGSTVSDTTLFSGVYNLVPKALSAAVTLVYGQRYAFALLIVSSAAMPTVLGSYMTDANQAPRISGRLTGQTNLPSTITAGSILDNGINRYIMGY